MRADPAGSVEAGQAVYTKPVLAAYDLFVLRFSNRCVWRCPWPRLLALYDSHVSANHLDVGVGTGFFLDRCRFPIAQPRLALMDLNPNCLQTTGRRLARYRPETWHANVLEPIRIDAQAFASIGLNYLLHCLPGTIRTKGAALGHLRRLLVPGGVMFGATLLHDGVRRNAAARRLMALHNARGIFCNAEDDLEGLRTMLHEHLDAVKIEVVGCVALFSGRG